MKPVTRFCIELPDWVVDWWQAQPDCLGDSDSRMAAAIWLADENARRKTGGPFGALVVEETSGRLIAPGVNRVEPGHCSSAHGEIVALSLAQQRLGRHSLKSDPPLQLVTSCEPCAMCLGAIPWSGVSSVLCGATKADAEETGFDEGERVPDWEGVLARRGISVETGLLRERARQVLLAYARSGGSIY